MSSTHKAIKSVVIIFIFTLLSKVMGFFRELTIASKFGLGAETDTFFMAISLITMIGNVLVVSLNTTFIPVLSQVEEAEGKSGKIYHANNALNISLVFAILIFAIVELTAPVIVKIAAPGFHGEQMSQLIWFLRFGIPVVIISSAIGITRGFLHSEMKFFETALSNISFNVVYLVYLVLFASTYKIDMLIFVHLIAVLSQFLLQVFPLRSVGFKYKPVFNLHDKYIRRMGVLILPVLAGIAIQDLNFLIDKSLASNLVSGSISALNYSVRVNNLVQVVFVTAITTVLFPLLTKAFSQNDKKTQIILVKKGFITILIITFPTMIASLLLHQLIIEAAFLRGKFDVSAVTMTGWALFYYAFALVPMGLRVFLNQIFYSIQDTRTPFYNSVVTLISNFIFSVILSYYMAYKGLALGTSISLTITVGFMMHRLKAKSIYFIDRDSTLKIIKVVFSSVIMGVAIVIMKTIGYELIIQNSLAKLLGYAFVGVIVYFITLKLLYIEELDWFIRSFAQNFRKGNRKPSSSEWN